MAITLVQFTNPAANTTGGNSLTISVNLPGATTKGNTLLCIVGSIANDSNPNIPAAPVAALPTTAGLTWVQIGQIANPSYDSSFGNNHWGSIALFAAYNAPSIPSTTHTSIGVTTTLGTSTLAVGSQLLEISGVGSLDAVVTATGDNGTITAGNITLAAAADFLLVTAEVPGSDSETSPGTGYTYITTGGVGSNYAASQYQITSAKGTYGTSFGSTASGYWSVIAAAFKAAASGYAFGSFVG